MNSMLGVVARIPLFKLYRSLGWPALLPLNLTISPSPKCNSRCLTCNIWMKREDELTLGEWEKILRSLGTAPYWFTISGGEPLMYPHVVALAQLVYEHCRPGVISIPTNGILASIPERVEQIAASCPQSHLILNLSLDGLGKNHDIIRGVAGNFENLERRLEQLLDLRTRCRNLSVGIHSVVSKFNSGHIDELIEYADRSGVDQFITEIAEPRVELDTVGLDITPEAEDYAEAVRKIIAYVNGRRFTRIARVTEALRVEYYELVNRVLQENDQVIDCYAGWSSAQIYSDGTVWPCCVRADNLGNLRDHNYDFKEIWFGDEIKKIRRSIAAKECHCTLANASYTSMLEDLPTLARVSGKLAIGAVRRGASRPAEVSDSIAAKDSSQEDGRSSRQNGLQPRAGGEAFEWLNRFQETTEKKPNYAQDTLAAYALGMRAGGSLAGVVVHRGLECCDAAHALPSDKIYSPGEAPRLPLPNCSRIQCECVYRPAMVYPQPDGQ